MPPAPPAGTAMQGSASDALVVTGCIHPTIGQTLIGSYRQIGMNHGRPLFQKDNVMPAAPCSVLIYFWDTRDGERMCGWWFGPLVGGDQVWAFNPNRASPTPPAIGWHVPWDGLVDARMRVAPCSNLQNVAQCSLPEQMLANGPSRTGCPGTDNAWHQQEVGAKQGWQSEEHLGQEGSAVLAVRQVIQRLSTATFTDFPMIRTQLDAALSEQQVILGTHISRLKVEAQEVEKQSRHRLQRCAVEALRRGLGQLVAGTLENFERLKSELQKVHSDLKDWLGSEALTLSNEISTTLSSTEKRIAEVAKLEVQRAIQNLATASPENADSFRAQLEQALSAHKVTLGVYAEEMRDAGIQALEKLDQRIQQILKERVEEKEQLQHIQNLVDVAASQAKMAGCEVEAALSAISNANAEDEAVAPPERLLLAICAAESADDVARRSLESALACLSKTSASLEAGVSNSSSTTSSNTGSARASACQEAKLQLGQLQAQLTCETSALDEIIRPLKVLKQKAHRRTRAAKRVQEHQLVFNRYDLDGDRKLGRPELLEFAKKEYNLNVREELIERILKKLSLNGVGVPFSNFARLRLILGIERSEIRARAVRAAEAEKLRQEKEDALRKEREIAERKVRARTLLDDASDFLAEMSTEIPKVEEATQPLQEGRLDSVKLSEAADSVESSVKPVESTIAAARSKLAEVEQVLGDDVLRVLKQDLIKLQVQLKHNEARIGQVHEAVACARKRVLKKQHDEEKSKKQRKIFSKLERAYEELEDDCDDDFDDAWT